MLLCGAFPEVQPACLAAMPISVYRRWAFIDKYCWRDLSESLAVQLSLRWNLQRMPGRRCRLVVNMIRSGPACIIVNL
ncbi:hypothetical protein HBH77_179750 [Parastagonospora nodorum]|nr:hypothetical protein HBH77_179750 [Parastagonospora nodorum]